MTEVLCLTSGGVSGGACFEQNENSRRRSLPPCFQCFFRHVERSDTSHSRHYENLLEAAQQRYKFNLKATL